MKKAPKTVDTYIEDNPKAVVSRLKAIRRIIRKNAPGALESISYGLVGYKLDGKPLVYFGGFKKHVGFFATPSGHAAFKKEMAKYKNAKGSVQFPNDEPLPLKLIERMVKFRVKENSKK